MKITTRFVLLLISSVGIVYVMLQLYSSHYYTALMEKQITLESDALTFNAISKLSELQKDTESVVKTAAVGIKLFNPDAKSQIYDYLSDIITANKNSDGHIFGIGFSFNPEYRFFSPYVSYQDEEIQRINLAAAEDYTDNPWYQFTKTTEKPIWTEPYFAHNNKKFFITYSYPVIQDGKMLGILKADVSLGHLREYLERISISNQYIVIIAKNTGNYISHPDETRIAVSGLNSTFPENTRRIINEMMIKNAGSSSFLLDGKKYLINYMTIRDLNWVVGIVFDEEAIMDTINQMAYKNMSIILIGLFFILAVIYIVTKSVTKPLRNLNNYVKGISDGGLSQNPPEINSNDEIAELSRNFAFMQEELKHYIETERKIAAEKEKIDSQLRLARDIQSSFLPNQKFLANDSRFSLSSYLKAAENIGGDLYDFFLLDDDTLFAVIGDVADKGIPASLYMSVTMAFARVLGKMYSSPESIASYINNYFILYNKNNMFVTMMILVIDIKTGTIKILDAGHGMIKLISKGTVKTIPTESNIALGVKADFNFKSSSFTMDKGDMLLLYTDGVTDAVNPEKKQFGEQRLNESLRNLDSQNTASENLSIICDEINHFCKNAKAADDMAMILFEYKG
jgi:sigma-B regulation protein RsbU (phosphoserine phosphatase)